MLSDILLIFLILLLNGLFVLAEMAIVSARKSRLRRMAESGDARARLALDLAENPSRFLSVTQLGITLIGILAGAFGGGALADKLTLVLNESYPSLVAFNHALALFIVVTLITYASLVLGELIPKRLALAFPESLARLSAPVIDGIARVCGPAVHFLTASTDFTVGLFGLPAGRRVEDAVTEEEISGLLHEGHAAGVFHQTEPEMVRSVMQLDQLQVNDVMTPRPKIIWVGKDDPHDTVWRKIVAGNHSYFPVFEGQRDRAVGVVSVKAIYANLAAGVDIHVASLMTHILIVPETQSVTQLLETFRTQSRHLALAADEFGAITGLITLHDVMEAIVGDLAPLDERSKPMARQRPDGSWLIDGILEIDKLPSSLNVLRDHIINEEIYETVAGFVFHQLGHAPREGEVFEQFGHRFEIVDMDGHRVDKILLAKVDAAPAP